MDLFVNGRLNVHAFDPNVRHATHDLSDVLLAAANTRSTVVESTHFLIVLPQIPVGVTECGLKRRGISLEQWQSGLEGCVRRSPGGAPLGHLTEDSLHPSARQMLDDARERCDLVGQRRISEAALLWSALRNLTPQAESQFNDAGISVTEWCAEIDKSLRPAPPLAVLPESRSGTQSLLMDAFSPGARKVLRRMAEEAESLGYQRADPRHLLLALLAQEGGSAPYGLHRQGIPPRRVQETVALSLRGSARRARSIVPLDSEHLQGLLQVILRLAGELAGRANAAKIDEPCLFRALLAVDSAARRILEEQNVDIEKLRANAEEFEVTEDDEDEDRSLADIETLRESLRNRLVGQDDAIEQILPYLELLRFGFNVRNRPVGVFLFCGPSGTGKTEMAKELARCIYQSEENLLFLEMGQFKHVEHVNQFIGAPPGYVGYGEGKLTNGLRDKPRSVVLFDEVEKAHELVQDALLRFLDEGKIEDPAGPVRDGTQCVVVLTSNVAADELRSLWAKYEGSPNRRTEMRKELRARFRRHNFKVEFLNRVDEVILFKGLEEECYAEIARRQLAPLVAELNARQQIDVELDDSVANAIGAYCAVMDEGARPVGRLTRSLVLLEVARFVAHHHCTRPVRLKVSAQYCPGRTESVTEMTWVYSTYRTLEDRLPVAVGSEPVSKVDFR